jgi:hypothetical protein
VCSSGWAIKNTGSSILNTGRPDGSSGHPDDARATSLSPFFWCDVFGRACRRGSWDFWHLDGTTNGLADEPLRKESILQQLAPIRTGMNPIRTLVVVWLFSFHFAHEH